MRFQRRDWSGRLVYVLYDFECIASELCEQTGVLGNNAHHKREPAIHADNFGARFPESRMESLVPKSWFFQDES
jgi:hypothetical protein